MVPEAFTFKTRPWVHQFREFEYSRDFIAWGLLWQMRTGKTKVIIDTAAHLFQRGKIDGVIIVTRSGVHANWIRREFPKHCSVPYQAQYWEAERLTQRQYRRDLIKLALVKRELLVLSVNTESAIRPKAQLFLKELVRKRLMLIVDECHDFRTPSSKWTKMIHRLAKHCLYRRILTGTNNGNSPLGNWAQFEILEPQALGFKKFTQFRKRYAVLTLEHLKNPRTGLPTGRAFYKVDGYQRLEELQHSIDRLSSTILRRDCPDLPPLVSSSYDVDLTVEQRRVYRELKRDFMTELASGVILTAREAGVRQLKLQQVLSNFMIDPDGRTHIINTRCNPRLEALLTLVDDLDEKIIIWCRFQVDLDIITEAFQQRHLNFVAYHGRVSKKDRIIAETRFREDPNCRLFLGQPQSAGLGLDLSAAGVIIWYSHTSDIVIRDQANERATEKGSTAVAVIDLITPKSVDERYMDILEDKRSTNEFMADNRTDWRSAALNALKADGI